MSFAVSGSTVIPFSVSMAKSIGAIGGSGNVFARSGFTSGGGQPFFGGSISFVSGVISPGTFGNIFIVKAIGISSDVFSTFNPSSGGNSDGFSFWVANGIGAVSRCFVIFATFGSGMILAHNPIFGGNGFTFAEGIGAFSRCYHSFATFSSGKILAHDPSSCANGFTIADGK